VEPSHSLDYNSFTAAIIETIKQSRAWHRVVSIDLETKIEKKADFLTGERLLGIGLARRVGSEIELRTIKLKDDTDEAEIELLMETSRFLSPIKPLILLGYNISGYDYPLLNMKLKWHDDFVRARAPEGAKPQYPKEYWSLKDALTRAYILDMMHPLRYALAEHDGTAPKYKSLSDVVSHQRFAEVALMRRKQLACGTSTEEKGQRIYRMWKEGDPDFERYLEGDVHDVLLLAEELYGIGHQ
jgi:DNA polymerase elongation subunit (family B)